MKLYDPERPTLLNGKPCWIRKHFAIGNLQIFPLESGDIKLSIFLPVKDENFACMEYDCIIDAQYLPSFLENFKNDPEEICEFYFKNPDPQLMPELRVGGRLSAENYYNERPKQSRQPTEKIAVEELDF